MGWGKAILPEGKRVGAGRGEGRSRVMVRGGEGQHRTRAGQGEKSEDRVRWGQVESKEGTRQGEGRITEMQSKDKARGHREGPTRERGAGGGSSSLGGHDGSRDPAGLDALGEKTGSWVGLQLVGSQLRPTLIRLLITASRSAEGLLPTSRSIHSGLVPTGWSVSKSLSALLSDQPGDPSTLLAGHPGLTTSPRVTLELPIHPPHPRATSTSHQHSHLFSLLLMSLSAAHTLLSPSHLLARAMI